METLFFFHFDPGFHRTRSCWVGIGQGSASWLGGLVLHRFGDQHLFQGSAVLALLAALGPCSAAICRWERRGTKGTGRPQGEKCHVRNFQ